MSFGNKKTNTSHCSLPKSLPFNPMLFLWKKAFQVLRNDSCATKAFPSSWTSNDRRSNPSLDWQMLQFFPALKVSWTIPSSATVYCFASTLFPAIPKLANPLAPWSCSPAVPNNWAVLSSYVASRNLFSTVSNTFSALLSLLLITFNWKANFSATFLVNLLPFLKLFGFLNSFAIPILKLNTFLHWQNILNFLCSTINKLNLSSHLISSHLQIHPFLYLLMYHHHHLLLLLLLLLLH